MDTNWRFDGGQIESSARRLSKINCSLYVVVVARHKLRPSRRAAIVIWQVAILRQLTRRCSEMTCGVRTRGRSFKETLHRRSRQSGRRFVASIVYPAPYLRTGSCLYDLPPNGSSVLATSWWRRLHDLATVRDIYFWRTGMRRVARKMTWNGILRVVDRR